jgi:hypothetical protein
MPCYSAANVTLWLGYKRLGKAYATQQECEQECSQPSGACCNAGVCRTATPCQCAGQGDSFLGIGTQCSPNPCNPLP